jgi:hypothetical protein
METTAELTTVEQLSDALLTGARDSMDDPSADLPPLFVRLAKRQEATDKNARRSGPKRWYPDRESAWPLTVDGQPPISSIVAAIASDERNNGEVRGVFDLVYLRKVTDGAGVERLEAVGPSSVVRLNIGRASDGSGADAKPAAPGVPPLPEQIGPAQATALHEVWRRREEQVQAVEGVRLKHDSTLLASLEKLAARNETAITLALTAAQNQITMANAASASAVATAEAVEKVAGVVNRTAEALQQAAKGVQLAAESSYNRQLSVALPPPSGGAVKQFFEGVKELVPVVMAVATGGAALSLPAPAVPAASAPEAPAAPASAPEAPAAPVPEAPSASAPAPEAPAAAAEAPAPPAAESVEAMVNRLLDSKLEGLVAQFQPLIAQLMPAPGSAPVAPAEAPAPPAEAPAAAPVKSRRRKPHKESP